MSERREKCWLLSDMAMNFGRDHIVVSTSHCGPDNPGSNPSRGTKDMLNSKDQVLAVLNGKALKQGK